VLIVSHDRDFLDKVATSVLVAEGDGRWVDYAGGYSDMLAQRGTQGVQHPERSPKAKAVTQPVPAGESAAAAKRLTSKLSFNEQQTLLTLPARMEALGRDIAKLEAALADPDLYARDPARFTKVTETLERCRQELASAEERWLELEIRREEAGA
jgi:ABC transport system ATP-binding/permease protein